MIFLASETICDVGTLDTCCLLALFRFVMMTEKEIHGMVRAVVTGECAQSLTVIEVIQKSDTESHMGIHTRIQCTSRFSR